MNLMGLFLLFVFSPAFAKNILPKFVECEGALAGFSIREVRKSDEQRLSEIMNHARVRAMSGDPEANVKAIVKSALWSFHNADRWFFLEFPIVLDNKVIGHVQMVRAYENGEWNSPFSPSIGFSLDPEYWGRGFMTSAVRQIVAFAFDKLGMVQIRAAVDPSNIASQEVLKKIGFKLTGLSAGSSPDAMEFQLPGDHLYSLDAADFHN